MLVQVCFFGGGGRELQLKVASYEGSLRSKISQDREEGVPKILNLRGCNLCMTPKRKIKQIILENGCWLNREIKKIIIP